MNAIRTGPAVATLARLRHLDEYLAAEIGPPQGDDWYPIDSLVSGNHIGSWLDDLARDNGGQRDVAGAYLGSWLTGAVVSVPVSAMVLERRVPLLGAGLWLHRHDEGWFDRIAFASAKLNVLADDTDADHPDAMVLADQTALAEHYAESLVKILTPLLGAVRQRAPYGSGGLWGAVADDVTGTALGAARLAGSDGWAAWALSQVVLDHVAARQTHLRRRPTPFPVSWSGGEALFQVKGTCCLYYKTHDGPPDPESDSYCSTCPFRGNDDRLSRLRHHLEHPKED